LVKRAKLVYCTKCGRVGRLERNSNTMQFRYPIDKVHVPNVEHIWTISEAWDYAAKVCLHMSQKMMKFPPPTALDESIATSWYDHFRTVVPPYTDNEIAKFESLHRRIIKSRILAFKNNSKNQEEEALSEQEKPQDEQERGIKRQPDYDTLSFETKKEHIHTPLPANTGKVTRSTLAFLYGAVVCSVISRQSYDQASAFKPSEDEKIVAKVICTEFQFLYLDERMRKHPIDWLKISLDVRRLPMGAVRTKYATKLDNGEIVKLTRKQIKKMAAKTSEMAQQLNTNLPLFEGLFKRYGQYTKNDPLRAASFVFNFLKTQLSIYDQSTRYRYASVIHGVSDKCPVSPYEFLRVVGSE
jgi:hypothetical protein